jgi:YYY domain-containing protein
MLSIGLAAIILVAALFLRRLKLPPFEALVGLLLLIPIMAAWLSLLSLPVNGFTYLVIIGLIVVAMVALFGKDARTSSLTPVFILATAFAVFHQLSLLWPDFIAIGERLRDYSILSAVINAPDIFKVEEPWLAGYQMNYYLYWYRFGHLLAKLSSLHVGEIYHVLISLTFAIFLTTLYQLLRTFLNFSAIYSLLGALIITIGSNIQGVIAFIGRSSANFADHLPDEIVTSLVAIGNEAAGGGGWWGPSRVINGAITEFPSWSFILGDAHPHFLNLLLIPFFILILSKINYSALNAPAKVSAVIIITAAPYLWLFGSNAWEAPIWAGMCVIFVLLAISIDYLLAKYPNGIKGPALPGKQLFIVFSSLALLVPALLLSSAHINDPGYSFRLIGSDIPRTTIKEFFLHWGFPASLITLASFYLLKNWPLRLIFLALIILSFSYTDAFPFMALLFLINAFRLGLELPVGLKSLVRSRLIMEAIGISALGLVLLPEVLFLDDTYGGENERMNTIFKIYSANWALLHLFAFYMLGRLFRITSRPAQYSALSLVFVGLVLLSGFSFQTAMNRRISAPLVHTKSMGLNEIERILPGSSEAILSLRDRKALSGPAIILEAQGPPFSYTSHISTLSDNKAYLGWANHMNLLIRDYDEIRRREETTEATYRSVDCLKTKQILQKEGINKVVLGPLEIQRYGTHSSAFDCLDLFFSKKDYQIYSVD